MIKTSTKEKYVIAARTICYLAEIEKKKIKHNNCLEIYNKKSLYTHRKCCTLEKIFFILYRFFKVFYFYNLTQFFIIKSLLRNETKMRETLISRSTKSETSIIEDHFRRGKRMNK